MPQYKIHHRLRFMKYKYINSTLLGFKHEMALSWLASLGIILYTVVFPSQGNLTTVTPFTPNWSQNGLNVSPIHRVNQYIVLMNKKRHIFGSGFDWKWYLIVFNSSDGRPTTGQHHLCAPLDRTYYSRHFRQFGWGHFDALLVCSFKGLLNSTVCPWEIHKKYDLKQTRWPSERICCFYLLKLLKLAIILKIFLAVCMSLSGGHETWRQLASLTSLAAWQELIRLRKW